MEYVGRAGKNGDTRSHYTSNQTGAEERRRYRGTLPWKKYSMGLCSGTIKVESFSYDTNL